jgi:tetratricopeptide (TPR) repeat protein
MDVDRVSSLGQRLHALDLPSDERELLDDLLAQERRTPTAIALRAEIADARGQYENAAVLWRAAAVADLLSLDALGSAKLLGFAGIAHFQAGNLTAAVDELRRARPHWVRLRGLELAALEVEALSRLRRFTEAMEALPSKDSLKVNDHDMTALRTAAAQLLDQGGLRSHLSLMMLGDALAAAGDLVDFRGVDTTIPAVVFILDGEEVRLRPAAPRRTSDEGDPRPWDAWALDGRHRPLGIHLDTSTALRWQDLIEPLTDGLLQFKRVHANEELREQRTQRLALELGRHPDWTVFGGEKARVQACATLTGLQVELEVEQTSRTTGAHHVVRVRVYGLLERRVSGHWMLISGDDFVDVGEELNELLADMRPAPSKPSYSLCDTREELTAVGVPSRLDGEDLLLNMPSGHEVRLEGVTRSTEEDEGEDEPVCGVIVDHPATGPRRIPGLAFDLSDASASLARLRNALTAPSRPWTAEMAAHARDLVALGKADSLQAVDIVRA